MSSSRIPGFYKLPIHERRRIVGEWAGLTGEELETLGNLGNLPEKIADSMIENVVGGMTYPFAVATNFLINGRERLIPMVIEETSVVAAASNAARMLRHGEGIGANAERQEMISQIHLVKVDSPWFKAMRVIERKKEILEHAAQQDPTLLKYGGGPRDLEVRVLEHPALGGVIVVHLVVDVRDAMGANTVNTMAEAVAPILEKITGGEARLRIVSNHAVYRVARAWAATPVDEVGGMDVARKIMEASILAEIDPYRAVTHNKGIMNGVIAVALATGQDHRAIEAGAHAYAARTGVYRPLSRWEVTQDGLLAGSLEIPLQVGVVGGAVKVHPVARIALKILGVSTARELAEVMAAVGLAQNLAALRALVTEGIQKGHMRLHARNLAIMAGATGDLIDRVAEKMVKDGRIRYDYAKELVEKAARGEPLD
ncbi:hydroxymethylglutaryl-CoA reductase, degradative [Desulfurococcus mucosus]|uniref:3-hydroxy-3-methylglutaryl coenzyme A reductase n=1 Tax=Desulfurococcus mucosus (strain ATCC 35584 / DSM 2162 / JCM 9187 / O7/1) TaxID=765177 RepID=E8R8E8_DESM0|nr:hydroxymethylglutaryl-CoA reductase, degradative [Desulfurococcus mucosus]ADV64774.1 hydroxymethylglutaryl-CoA reductase, degradative [Desulfurococcus mucosus DSM 2162]